MTAIFTAARNPGVEQSFLAGAAITANQAVKLDTTSGKVIPTAAITDLAIGVATQTVSSGDPVLVQLFGRTRFIAKNAVTLGDQLMPSTTSGALSTAAGATAVSCGVALDDCADGATGSMLFAMNLKGPLNA